MTTEKQTGTNKTRKQLDVETGQILEHMNNLMGDVNTMLGKLRQSKGRIVAQKEAERQRIEAEERAAEQASNAISAEPSVTAQPVAEKETVSTVANVSMTTEHEEKQAVTSPSTTDTSEKQTSVVAEAAPQAQAEAPTVKEEAQTGSSAPIQSAEQTRTQRPQGEQHTQRTYDDRRTQRPYDSTQRQQRGTYDSTQRPQRSTTYDSTQRQQRGPYDSTQRPQRSASDSGQRPQRPNDGMRRPTRPGEQSQQRSRTGVPQIIAQKPGIRTDTTKPVRPRADESDKHTKNKKAKMKESAPSPVWDDDAPMGNRRKVRRGTQGMQQTQRIEPIVIDHVVLTAEKNTVKDLSEKIGKPVSDIIKKLMMLGVMATINQEIDYDTCELIVAEFGITLELQLPKTSEEALSELSGEDEEESLVTRPPVVTIMGHVDHGKTSLLDAIRNTSVTAGEAGGITQHIGAYTVKCNDRMITFIDTPGHEAFTAMRARGAQVTDIVILVVAADDGIMPQTIEAINHSKAAGVPIIVAVNKIDKETANPDRIKQQLNEQGLLIEDWGGDVICVNVSAKKKIGLENLLEMILLQADVLELKANPDRLAKGTIVEAELDKGKGPVATVLVQNGTLHVGDCVLAGTATGRVRAMLDDKGRRVQSAGPSFPVQITGFSSVPTGGDVMMAAKDEKLLRSVVQERINKIRAESVVVSTPVTLSALFERISSGQQKELNIIVKADVQGSVEAVKQALEKLSNEEVKVRCIHGGVGAITSTDVALAAASNAIVTGFNVRPDAAARQAMEREGVDVRLYSVIYSAIEDIEKAMKGMFAPQFEEVILGRISVRDTIKISGVGTIAGGYVQDGKVQRNAQVRVVRDGIVVHEGKISSLKRFKDDVREVATGYECGVGIENFNDLQVGDVIEVFIMQEVER